MPSFILRNIDPDFWRRVQSKARLEGVSIKELILRLLTTWLATIVLFGLVGCSSDSRTNPTSRRPPCRRRPRAFA